MCIYMQHLAGHQGDSELANSHWNGALQGHAHLRYALHIACISVLQCVAMCCDSELVRNGALQGNANLRYAVHVSKETNIHERRPAIETYKYEKRLQTRPVKRDLRANMHRHGFL